MLDIERRRLALLERFSHIQRALDQISAHKESLTYGARRLLERTATLMRMVRSTMDRRWSFLDELEARSGKPADAQRLRLVGDLQDVLRELGTQIIPVLEGGSPNFIPFEIDPIINQVVDVIAPNGDLTPVLYSSHAYNYSIKNKARFLEVWRRKLRAEEELSDEQLAEGFVWISTPRLERDSASLHATALGHELGHLRDWQVGISKDLLKNEPLASFNGKTKPISLDELKKNIVDHDRFTSLRKRWLEELVADVYSALLLGPAAFFCLAELASSVRPLDFDSDTHPGPDRRLHLMAQVLRISRFDKIRPIRRMLETVELDVSNALSRETQLPGEIPTYAWEACAAVVPDVVNRCRGTLSDADVFTKLRWRDVREAASRLERLLPHGEYRKKDGSWSFASYRVILNAAWLVKLTRLETVRSHLGLRGGPAPERQMYASSILDGLVLKSFEISTYRRKAVS